MLRGKKGQILNTIQMDILHKKGASNVEFAICSMYVNMFHHDLQHK